MAKGNGFKIEKGIPIAQHGQSKYSFGDMEVGDSVLGDKTMRQSAFSYGKRNKMEFTSRKEGESVRIHRTA